MRAVRTTATIEIDGWLRESAWLDADSATGFWQALPRDGVPPTEQSVARILYDDRNLYVGAMLYDSEPERLMIPGLEQDFRTENSDLFGVAIDTYHDRQNAFLFAVNPAGAIFDAQNFNDSRYTNRAWEGVVHVGAKVLDNGWSVELAIPLTTLRFNPGESAQTWGINFLRRVRRLGEDSYWAPLSRQHRVHKMSRAGRLTGLEGLQTGTNLTVKPYVSGATTRGTGRGTDTGESLEGGLDLKYGVTPRLTLDVTALTDFSQVEVDQEQVNLTRFSLFFPEQRDFFLENDGIFSLGDVSMRNYRTGSSSREFRLFHSRRIGLSDDRRPIPIGGGARLTGRVGDVELGLLNMQTRASGSAATDDLVPAENFSVVRLRKAVFGNSDVGAMFINRQGTSGDLVGVYNRAFGVDANLSVLRNLMVNTYLAKTAELDQTGSDVAGYLQAAWRDRVWDVSGFVKYVGDAFNPEVGFVRRRAMHQGFLTVGAHPQPKIGKIQEINPFVDVRYTTDLDWKLESRSVTGGLGGTFNAGDRVTVEVSDNFERLVEPTDIAGVTLAAGDYGFREVRATYMPSGARWISGRFSASRGGFYDGDRTSVSATASIRPDYHVQLDLIVQHNDLTLAGQDFTADVFGGRLRYAYSTKLFASAFVQYNRSADELVTNLRLNVIHAPLSDIFLVFTERRDLAPGVGDRVIDRVLTAKVTKLFSF